ncbi:MAG: hypothetical protein GH158_05690 [Dehalococcoidia bacterium]|nr:hypothetical protein [Dehalococcoidia bacterium]
MTGKIKLYIGLLVLGVVVIGGGVWMLAKSPPKIDIPEGNPVIYEQLDYVMRGEFSYLYIYGDGSIIYIEEKGLRIRSPLNPPARTWRTAKFQPEQLDSLLAYFENSSLDKLDKYYQFPGKPIEGGGFSMGDMSFTISINSENLSKTVTAFGYLTPDHGETYPDMPSPLNEIYGRLKVIALATEEVYRENI